MVSVIQIQQIIDEQNSENLMKTLFGHPIGPKHIFIIDISPTHGIETAMVLAH